MVVKQKTRRDRTTIYPITHKELFQHCANGQKEVTNQRFNRHVKPLLFLHGVTVIEYEG